MFSLPRHDSAQNESPQDANVLEFKRREDPKRTFPHVRVLVAMIYAQERSKEKDGKRESDRCP